MDSDRNGICFCGYAKTNEGEKKRLRECGSRLIKPGQVLEPDELRKLEFKKQNPYIEEPVTLKRTTFGKVVEAICDYDMFRLEELLKEVDDIRPQIYQIAVNFENWEALYAILRHKVLLSNNWEEWRVCLLKYFVKYLRDGQRFEFVELCRELKMKDLNPFIKACTNCTNPKVRAVLEHWVKCNTVLPN